MILRVNIFTLLGLLLVVANVVSSSGSAGGISAAKYSGAGSATMSSTAQSSHHSKSVFEFISVYTTGACAEIGCIYRPQSVLHQDMPTLLEYTALGHVYTPGVYAAPGQVYTAKG